VPDAASFQPPEIDDADIAWACGVMGLPATAFAGRDGTDPRLAVLGSMETLDIEACPGSGKTTLLVAKLAILANKWRHHRQGICVLSHTNAARNEIETKLSSCSAGTALLRYPHFVGTIHSFVNEFLAIPWLRSQGIPIKVIDTEIALNVRWSKVPGNTKAYLRNQNRDKYCLTSR
jgi:DNA helicase-2/ATP-dependent DNA helicase PcrA